MLGDEWKALARRFQFGRGDITAFEVQSRGHKDKVLDMLCEWLQRKGTDATYSVLYSALSHEFVGRMDLAEKFCLNH